MREFELESFTGRGGQLRYRCPGCGFDSYSEREVLKHWKGIHMESNVTPGPTLFDADDRPIEREIDAPDSIRDIGSGLVRS